MGPSLVWTLGLIFFNVVLCKHTKGDHVTLKAPEQSLYLRDKMTLRCVQNVQRDLYFYKNGSLLQNDTNHKLRRESGELVLNISPVSTSDQGFYSCGTKEGTQSTKKELKVTAKTRRVHLKTSSETIPEQSSVTLSCDVEGFKGTYGWFRQNLASDSQRERMKENSARVSISRRGVYFCRGRDKYIVTELSYKLTVLETVPTVSLNPNWSEIFSGDSLTLRCEIEDRGNTEWTYQWSRTGSVLHQTTREYTISRVTESDSGHYRCRGEGPLYNTTLWSTETTLEVLSKLQPVLSVSPSWLTPGVSVSLSCGVKRPSAGWTFYWYKAVPHSSDSYRYELLPGHSNGTEQDSFTVHHQTNTAGFVCRAGRGRPLFYSEYSQPKFVWTKDVESPVSLTVSPDRSQHFTSDKVSLSCESSSTNGEWRLKGFSQNGLFLQQCSSYWTDKPKCDFSPKEKTNAVFWCESGSGELSNALNITFHTRPKEHISSFPVMLIIGLICAIVLFILLLLLWRCRKSKDLCLKSVRSNQSFAEDHMTSDDYTSPPNDATYSTLEFKIIKERRTCEQEQSCVYSSVRPHSAADECVTYAQVNHLRKGKARRKTKTKSSPSVAEETLYSEVR